MQEISSISIEESSSETVQKHISGLTVDPLNEFMYAIVKGNDSKESNQLCRIPSAATKEEQVALTQLNEMRNQEYQESGLVGLAEKRQEKVFQKSEANPLGQPRYLQPNVIVETRAGKQISTTDTYCEPDCLRFCPSNSSNQVEISLSGFHVRAKAASQITRTNKGFNEGVHFWEFICPISCSTLQLGVSNISNRNQSSEVFQQFRTTTPRVVGIELNLEKLTLNFWLNGRYLKERMKKIPEGHIWYPTVKFKESDYFIILNPFAQGRGHSQEELNTNYLPNSLRQVESYIYQSYIEGFLKNHILAYGLPNINKDQNLDDFKKQLKITNEKEEKITQIYVNINSTIEKPLMFAIIMFENELEAIKYYHNNTDLKLLTPKQISKLLHITDEKEKAQLGLPSYLETPLELSKQVLNVIQTQIVDKIQLEYFNVYSGLSKINDSNKLSTQLSKLYEFLKAGNLGNCPIDQTLSSSQADTDIQYLEHSDKLLLINDSELKLIHRHNGTFDTNSNLHFTMYPAKAEDLIRINLSRQYLKFLLKHIDWTLVSQTHYDNLTQFFDYCVSNSDDQKVIVPYLVALQVTKILLNVAIQQYEQLEQSFELLQEQEILHNLSKKHSKQVVQKQSQNELQLSFEFGQISILDAHQLLNILLGLEDELWAKIQDDQAPTSVKDLWNKEGARIHTAYGRLSSLITFPQSLDSQSQLDPITLAEAGIISVEDKYNKLQMFQEFKVELENLFEQPKSSNKDIIAALEKQFPYNLMLKGYPSWNVPLAQTLNNLPPSIHQNGLTNKKLVKHEKIEFVKTIQNSDFVMTAAQDGSVNIWNTRLRLNCNASYNFKSKLYQDDEFEALKPAILNQVNVGSEEKKSDGNVKLIIKKKTIKKPQTDEITEDILFTMFDEQGEFEDSDDANISDDGEDHTLEYLLDYYSQPEKLNKIQKEKEGSKEEEKVPIKEVENVERKPSVQTEGEVVPSEELLQQLIQMGFGVDISKKALIQTKNEGLPAALDALVEIQKEMNKKDQQQLVVKKTKILSYSCQVCTFINIEGKPICEMCGTPAPQSAYIEVKSEEEIKKEKEEEERKIQLELDRINKLEQEEKQKIEEERKKKEEEELQQIKLEELKQKTRTALQNSEVVDYVFASYNSGRDTKPFLVGVVMYNAQLKRNDIHFVRMSYSNQYLRQFIGTSSNYSCKVCNIPYITQEECLSHVFKYHQALLECDYPIFIGNQLLSKQWNLKLNRHESQNMKAEECGSVIWPFEKLDSFIQIGSDITKDNSMFIIGVGRKEGSDKQQIIIEKIEYSSGLEGGEFRIQTIDEDSQIFEEVGLKENIKSLYYCQKSKSLLALTENNVLINLSIEQVDNKVTLQLKGQLSLAAQERILKIQQGILYISTKSEIKRVVLDKNYLEKMQSKNYQKESNKIDHSLLNESDVLQMQIDPDKITMQDIQRYEKLMNGMPIGAVSNANHMLSNINEKCHQGTKYYSKHHWVFNNNEQKIQPIEMEFEHPTSLISLNLELSFNCNDVKKLKEQMKTMEQVPIIQNQIIGNQQEKEKPQILNLGLLGIQGSSESSQVQSQHDSSLEKPKDFLPLIVHHHKGASYNQTYQVCRLVANNNAIFASNYPKPEFYLQHSHQHIMNIDKVTVRSQTNSKCGAYPVGSGIIFMADHLQAFELTYPFHRFTLQDYNEWKQERMKDPTPLQQYEPVAYFEFETEIEITVDVDFKRPCKYIMFKPVNFRKKPVAFTQNINSVPMEIEFFGVSGSSYEDTNINGSQQLSQTINSIGSNYDIDIKVIDENLVLKTINNIAINQIQASSICISPLTLIENLGKDLHNNKLVGKSILKITDSHLQLKSIKGISLSINNNMSDLWELKGVTLEGVSVKIESQDADVKQQKPLFDNREIPTSYMRSCLLSPKYYQVVNKVLAKALSAQSHDYHLRIQILKFLNKIMKVDRDFIPLVLEDINLEMFLKLNLFDKETSGIPIVFEFLQNFQKDPKFCYDLYNILINTVAILPSNLIYYQGYEAFIGMLKWSVPINPEKTLMTILQTLYQQICLQKVATLQSKEQINFRTRFQFNTFPFDTIVFKPQKLQIQSQSKKEKEQIIIESEPRNILPVNEIIRRKFEAHHVYDVKFDQEMQVTDIKLYLGYLDQAYYKLIIKIYGKENLIYSNTFDEHYFAQFSAASQNPSIKISQFEDSLLIPHLDFKGTQFQVVVEFGISNSSMPKQNNKIKPPETLIEIYGQPTDFNITQTKLKEMLDKKAQEYWTEKAKLIKVGNSIQMLQLVKDSQTITLVPQGTQNLQNISQKTEEKEEQKTSSDQVQIQTQVSPKYHELETLQDELKGKLRSNDQNIKEIVEKIQNIQGNLYHQQVDQDKQLDIIPSLEYYMTITSDLSKIIRTIMKTQKIGKDRLSSIFRQVEPNGLLSNLCFEFFKRYIAYDQGQIKQDVLKFITECLYPLMTYDEKKSFTFKTIEEFLSSVQTTFSQKAVLEALNVIGIPEGEIISFLIQKLNISPQAAQQAKIDQVSPFIFMSSVLILAHNSLKQIDIPEPGQVIHRGVSCSSCQAKMIIGWRYKCGHCVGDVNLDEKCVEKHIQENPYHVMIIIQEPLPYNSKNVKISKSKQNKPLLPQFKFKEEKQDEVQKDVHQDFSCENCGKKPIIGNCYRCVNCEDYNLCQECYVQNLYDHFSYHLFMKLHKPLKHSEKNPTVLLQVLDPRLYAHQESQQTAKDNKAISMKKEELFINQEEEDFEDLQPLNISRSLSVPMPNKQNEKSKPLQQQEQHYEKLDSDQQFVVLFNTCVWICQDSLKVFSKEEKIVLLKLTIETILQLLKLTTVKYIFEVIKNKDTFFNLLVSILQLNSKELIALYRNLLDQFRQPPSLQRKIKEQISEEKSKQAAKSSDKKQQLNEDQATMKLLLDTMINHVQHFLKWLVDIGLNPELAKLQIPQGQDQWTSLIQNYTNQRVWLDHLSLILELFIKFSDELKDKAKNSTSDQTISNGLGSIAEEANENDNDDELMPLSMKRTISVPLSRGQNNWQQQQAANLSLQLIKSLVQLLYLNDSQPQKNTISKSTHFKEIEPSTKYLSQMWSLVLKSLTAVSINQLIEARIFDSLVSAFLISSEEIKQITFPQILAISETIAKQSVHSNDISKFISNLLFTTLENVTDNYHEKVGYSICQGWLDILISSSIARPQEYETKNQVYAKMSAEEISVFLKKTSQYLNAYLNKGNFEGSTGCTPIMVMRLSLACDLIYVIKNVENKNKPGQLAIQELFQLCSVSSKLRKEFQESMENLLSWLFLNARQAKDDTAMNTLGNTSTQTPATAKVKQITEYIEIILSLMSDDTNQQAIKIALQAMTTIVKKMNKSILELTQTNSLGYDISMKLSERTNEYFIKLLGFWLVSDQVASYFVFDLGGFEFLLDTIGVGSESENKESKYEIMNGSKEEQKQSEEKQQTQSVFLSLMGSDLAEYLESNIQEAQQQIQNIKSVPVLAKEESVKAQEEKTAIQLQEFSKSLQMVSNNGGDPISSYQKTDWSVNKRAYKHRIIIKTLTGQLRSEYWMLFSLPHPVEIKEIQIGFNNYWGSDTEVYAEPLSVLVEAGMEENNLSLVCNLQILKDDAFGSVSATVFGQNLQTFQISSSEFTLSSIEDIIQQKLSSLQNFKIQYIKFCMRRHVLSCLENSPLATKFTKPPAFGINYISMLGFDVSKTGDYIVEIKQEQKKTALEVLSIICSGDFSSILKVIANQNQTIEKMKKSFNQLASLVSLKRNLIEPTFIAISTYNTDMGDWIINQFLKTGKVDKHASLVGEIVMCNKSELPRRLGLLQEFVMSSLCNVFEEERSTHGTKIQKLLPFIEIFIQTLRITSPEIEEHQIDLGILEKQLTKIVSLLSAATQEREIQTKILIQLLVLLLCPPQPFTNEKVDVYSFTMNYLIEAKADDNSEIQKQKEQLASILATIRKDIATEILSKEILMQKLLNPDKDVNKEEEKAISNLQHCLRFWINVAQDFKVRICLNEIKFPIKLYQVIRENNPQANNKIIRCDEIIGETEMLLYVELIKTLTAGDEILENELAQHLMKDLEYLGKIRDMSFVNKVFLQLLRSESTIPVCIWPYDSENKKWLPTYKPYAQDDQLQVSQNNFVPSSLLQGEKRSAFIKNFKEIVGNHQKANIKKLIGSNWVLQHSQNEQGNLSQFQALWKNIENKAPVVILLQGETTTGSNVVYGCYASKGIPSIPQNVNQDQEYLVQPSQEDFVFCYIDDHSFHHFYPKSGGILAIYTDYEGGGAISVASDFFLMSYSYDFVFSTGSQYELDKIQINSNPEPVKEVPDQITFKKFEIWSIASTTSAQGQVPSQIKIRPSKYYYGVKGDKPVSDNLDVADSFSKQEFKHPWFNELSPYINFRANPVFMVPRHLSMSQLSKIMLDSNVVFKPRFKRSLSQTKELVSEIHDELVQDHQLKLLYNGIVDLEYEVNQLLKIDVQDEVKDKTSLEYEEATSDGNTQMIQGYVPKMGVFEKFENQGGVKHIISVTLASLKLWKAEDQAKSWELWLKELESFSQIPLFFQLFLKNSRCKDLLFKVLAGQPDTEINVEGKLDSTAKQKWEDEQKVAVQFNYKILSEAFQISNDLKLRDIAMQCGLLPRILERLGAISGEKPRTKEEESSLMEEEKKEEVKTDKSQIAQIEKNAEKKKRKGVGYSSKVGQTFNVTQYLENKKQRNDQIKNLIDICSNFINCKEWKAGDEVLDIILESALLPLLESAFRNGSWLEMAKEYEVYHSYLGKLLTLLIVNIALTRAIASQKTLVKCLIEIDSKYKPKQHDPIYRLLAKLNDLADIFINCLNQQQKAEKHRDLLQSEKQFQNEHETAMKLLSLSYKNSKNLPNLGDNSFSSQSSSPSEDAIQNLLQPLEANLKDILDLKNHPLLNYQQKQEEEEKGEENKEEVKHSILKKFLDTHAFQLLKNIENEKEEEEIQSALFPYSEQLKMYSFCKDKALPEAKEKYKFDDKEKSDKEEDNDWEDQDEESEEKSLVEEGEDEGADNNEEESEYETVSEESVESKNEQDQSVPAKPEKSKNSSSSSSSEEEDEDNDDENEDGLSSYGSDEESKESGEEDDESDSYYETDSVESNDEKHPTKKEEPLPEMDSEIPETLAREVIKTYKIVASAIDKLKTNIRDEHYIQNALTLPVDQAYKVLMADLRFDYMDMREPSNEQHYKHHYQSIAQQNQNPPSSKMVRLAQELADLSNALPYEHTNAIYVRVDQQRVDMMKAIICGASNSPYAHGCFEYDIFCDNNYPKDPPKMNLITTGSGAVRFNPNLYACGKVCLSLLGTWRGSATENWDPKLSTILQVLLSTQAIIMSDEVYFNEPGFENEAGTPEGEKKNEGYANIVRYCNIKFAMIEQIKRPPRGFETVIKRHFYLKKAEIMQEVNHWVDLAEKNEATYGGLVNDHNYNWANQFKQTKTKYKEMLVAAVKQLEEELNKLEKPTDYELKEQQQLKKKTTAKKQKRQNITEGKAELDIDMLSDEEEVTQINTESKKEMNVEDEAVKDRWSRYIGAMGVEAVAKQASANIFLSGAGALGIEISKNLVLSGCKTFTLHDTKPISYRDLSGQFFLNLEEDLLNEKKKKATRGEACLHRLQQLNYYVKCRLAEPLSLPMSVTEAEKEPWNFLMYDVIILTEASQEEIIFYDEYCRSKGKKFICADSYGVFTRVFNDFGQNFEILDKNGEDLQDVMIKNITNEEEGLIELLPNTKHKYEDGDEVLITQVEGMKLLEGQKHDDLAVKSDSINDTIHKVKVINPYSFRIGDTRKFDKYVRNGIAKQLKTKKILNFKSYFESMINNKEIPLDANLSIADFEKMQNNQFSHIAFLTLDEFKKTYNRMPGVWNLEDAELFIKIAKNISISYFDMKEEEDFKSDSYSLKFFYLFSFTCQGVFNPLCAFMGGLVAQECIKAITQKFTPTNQVFFYDAMEVLPEFDQTKHLIDFEEKYVKDLIKTKEISSRYDGLRIILGQDMIEKLANTRLFMVGAGAIGCELLKNYAMLGIGVGKPQPKKKLLGGQIILTDPDIIEVSNLNRQFLFREKHLRKPKSSTAASAVIYMNRDLKDNIIARLDKVHEGTSYIYTDQFYEELTVVTNALDNVQARRYIDARCVTAKTPLLESGTLGPKGHIQVVLPYKTESYGSMTDPEDNTEIPHCTLKMFPEETLHCVEWARDKFGKLFTQGPQNTIKILEEGENFIPISQQDTMSLKEAIKILKKKPKNFNDCIHYARQKFEKLFSHDIQQLLHVYPLDAKTKDGNYFWTLPKRPPVPMEFDEKNPLHCQFVASMACLRANIFKIEIPSKQPRSEEFRKEVGHLAAKVEVPKFVPDDEKAKEIQASVNKNVKEEEKKEEESKEEEQKVDPNDVEQLLKEFKQIITNLPVKQGGDLIQPEQFEKDNDQNFHIDFIYSMANCRSSNYKLDFMDWITVKLKAGRIVPALATTTAAVAGLQTLELVKLIKQCKKTDHRNVFLNLAVPIMQASEPADVLKTKLTENIEVTLWDRWEVKKGKNVKLIDAIRDIEEQYKGLEVRDVMKGNTPLYFHAIMNASGKEKEKEKILNSKVSDLVGTDQDDKYTDITVTCVRKGDVEDQIISGVPPVRVYFD